MIHFAFQMLQDVGLNNFFELVERKMFEVIIPSYIQLQTMKPCKETSINHTNDDVREFLDSFMIKKLLQGDPEVVLRFF